MDSIYKINDAAEHANPYYNDGTESSLSCNSTSCDFNLTEEELHFMYEEIDMHYNASTGEEFVSSIALQFDEELVRNEIARELFKTTIDKKVAEDNLTSHFTHKITTLKKLFTIAKIEVKNLKKERKELLNRLELQEKEIMRMKSLITDGDIGVNINQNRV